MNPSAVITGLKCALACLGVYDDFTAGPFHLFCAQGRERVQCCLTELAAGVERLASMQAAIIPKPPRG